MINFSSCTRLCLGPFPLANFSNCANQSDTKYQHDNTLNDGLADLFDDWESCRAFCYSNHPNATFFTYVSSDAEVDDDKYKRTCWCQSITEGKRPEGKEVLDGATSGEIECGGMQKILHYSVTFGKCTTAKSDLLAKMQMERNRKRKWECGHIWIATKF